MWRRKLSAGHTHDLQDTLICISASPHFDKNPIHYVLYRYIQCELKTVSRAGRKLRKRLEATISHITHATDYTPEPYKIVSAV